MGRNGEGRKCQGWVVIPGFRICFGCILEVILVLFLLCRFGFMVLLRVRRVTVYDFLFRVSFD